MTPSFTRKAKGSNRRGGRVQTTIELPVALFDRLSEEAYAANRSFAAHLLDYVERGLAATGRTTTEEGASQ